MSLNLRDLGTELESIRRTRRASAAAGGGTCVAAVDDGGGETAPVVSSAMGVVEDDARSSSGSSSAGPSPPRPTYALPPADAAPDSPGTAATCLLCLARAPSAVLLPCCHLNLCYLCAPLLMHRGAAAARAAARARDDEAEAVDAYAGAAGVGGRANDTVGGGETASPAAPSRRIPFNVALSRAVKSHPAARRLSIGGYVAPRTGRRGGELRGADVMPGTTPVAAATGADAEVGIARVRESDGRVLLARAGDDTGTTCPVCRAPVSAWLRVYT